MFGLKIVLNCRGKRIISVTKSFIDNAQFSDLEQCITRVNFILFRAYFIVNENICRCRVEIRHALG